MSRPDIETITNRVVAAETRHDLAFRANALKDCRALLDYVAELEARCAAAEQVIHEEFPTP